MSGCTTQKHALGVTFTKVPEKHVYPQATEEWLTTFYSVGFLFPDRHVVVIRTPSGQWWVGMDAEGEIEGEDSEENECWLMDQFHPLEAQTVDEALLAGVAMARLRGAT